MADVRDGARDEALPYGVDTLVLRMEWPAPAAAPRGYDGRMWRMRPLRGWTGGQAVGGEPSAGAEQGGNVAIPVADRVSVAGNQSATPVNLNAKVDALWSERAAITTEMDGLNASGDYGRAATELYQRLENRRDILESNIRSQLNSSLSGSGLQEPGDPEAWLRERAEQASRQPGAYDQMSAEEQRRFIRTHAPDYELVRSDEAARR